MDPSKFDAQIKAKNEELESLRSTMDTLSREFIENATHFIPAWCNEKVITAITNDPQATMALGREKLAAFKAELNRFLEDLPPIIERTLDKDIYWPHRQELPSKPRHKIPNYDYAHHGFRTTLHEGIRELFGHVGRLLIDKGFANAGGQSAEWRKKAAPAGGAEEVLEYAYSFGWDEKMEGIWKRYLNRYDQMLAINDSLKALEVEKARAEVQGLWEKL